MNGIFTLTWENIKGAVVYGLLTSLVTFLLVTGNSIVTHGSIYGLDWANILDQGILAVLGVFVASISIIKNLLTDNQGKFLGITKVIPDNTPAVATPAPVPPTS